MKPWAVVLLACSVSFLFAPALASAAPPSAAATEHGHGAHGHDASFEDINWFYGMLSEKEGVEPSLLFRPPGMPPPLGAMLLNSALLFYLLWRFGAPKLRAGLTERKNTIMRGIDDAARMQKDARRGLKKYKRRLEGISEEVEQVRRQTREAGEAERERVLMEAKETSARMQRDSRILVDQEFKAARERLLMDTADGAIRSAEEAIVQRLQPADHQRLAEEYLASIRAASGILRQLS